MWVLRPTLRNKVNPTYDGACPLWVYLRCVVGACLGAYLHYPWVGYRPGPFSMFEYTFM